METKQVQGAAGAEGEGSVARRAQCCGRVGGDGEQTMGPTGWRSQVALEHGGLSGERGSAGPTGRRNLSQSLTVKEKERDGPELEGNGVKGGSVYFNFPLHNFLDFPSFCALLLLNS